MPEKRCRHCQETKDQSAFWRNRRNPDGLQDWCQECIRASREQNRPPRRHLDRSVSTDLRLCTACLVAKPRDAFSPNRYTADHLESRCRQCVNESRNLRRQRAKRTPRDTPDQKHCSVCREVKPAGDFYTERASSDGLTSACRQCLNTKRRLGPNAFVRPQNPPQPLDHQVCRACGTLKPHSHFRRDCRTVSGLDRICRLCRKTQRDT